MSKKDNKISMPQTGAGLVRYFDEESVGPKLFLKNNTTFFYLFR